MSNKITALVGFNAVKGTEIFLNFHYLSVLKCTRNLSSSEKGK